MLIPSALSILLILVGLPASVGIALVLLFAFTALLADVLTVRLVVAGKRRGILGYETLGIRHESMNSPTVLKIYNAILVVALVTSVSFLIYALVRNFQWKLQVQALAQYEGATRATHDFQAGKLRLYVIAGERSDDKYSGSNDGPFGVWYPQYFPGFYPFRYATTLMVASYNDRMRFLHEHPDKSLEATNHRPNAAVEPTPSAP